ncbi:MAG: hypothetical protein ACKOOI_21460, partial [Pirellula sp.]
MRPQIAEYFGKNGTATAILYDAQIRPLAGPTWQATDSTEVSEKHGALRMSENQRQAIQLPESLDRQLKGFRVHLR